MNNVLNYLELSYCGAKMMHDNETMLKISNAIAAFELDVHKDCIITNGCYCQNCKHCDGFYDSTVKPDEVGICKNTMETVDPNHFCSYGTPRE